MKISTLLSNLEHHNIDVDVSRFDANKFDHSFQRVDVYQNKAIVHRDVFIRSTLSDPATGDIVSIHVWDGNDFNGGETVLGGDIEVIVGEISKTVAAMAADEGTKLTGKREYGQIPTLGYPIDFNGRWVVRDADGNYIDHDAYRNDLTSRHGKIDFNDGLAVPSNSFK